MVPVGPPRSAASWRRWRRSRWAEPGWPSGGAEPDRTRTAARDTPAPRETHMDATLRNALVAIAAIAAAALVLFFLFSADPPPAARASAPASATPPAPVPPPVEV